MCPYNCEVSFLVLNIISTQIAILSPVYSGAHYLEFVPPPGDGFSFEGGQLYCKDCFVATSGMKCSGCGQGVSPDELWVEAFDVTWHSQCFVCDVSIRDLGEEPAMGSHTDLWVVCVCDDLW